MYESIAVILVGIIICICVYTDYKYSKILNKLLLPGIILGFILNIYFYGITGLLDSMLRALFAMLLLVTLFLFKFLGAGDVKLFGVIGAFLSYFATARIIIYSFLVGGIISIIIILIRKNAKARFIKIGSYLKNCYLTKRVGIYNDGKKEDGGTFEFAYAVLGGYIVFLLERQNIIYFAW